MGPSISVIIAFLFGASHSIVSVVCQSFENCDYTRDLKPGVVYSVVSPNYNDPYPPGTFCRYYAQTRAGYQIVFTCNELRLPYSERCSGDRLHVSRSGDKNLADSDRYCTTPFSTRSFSNQIAVALLSPRESSGGRYRCEMYAVSGCDCGRRKQIKIVGGTQAYTNEFPAMSAIVEKSSSKLICGASIIDSMYVLTAAHCTTGRYANQLELVVGEHDFNTPSETPYTRKYEIASIIRHPNYSLEKDSNDIALIVMRRAIGFNAGVGPVCLPFKFHSTSFEGRKVEALGWGTQDFGGPISSRLRKVALDVVNQSRCEAAYPNSITSGQICTFSRGKDTCNYDSGGPLVYSDSNSLLYQIGITSYGINCASSAPSVGTRVSAYLDWIKKSTPYANYCVQ